MGWSIPWFSSFDSDFNVDFGVSPETPQPDVYQDGESFGLSVFLRDGDGVFRTYFTTNRGVEALGSVWTFLDLTPLGRQEEWEDSPEGYPQRKPYEWWRRHDEYEPASGLSLPRALSGSASAEAAEPCRLRRKLPIVLRPQHAPADSPGDPHHSGDPRQGEQQPERHAYEKCRHQM